jgi:hypothetical protein
MTFSPGIVLSYQGRLQVVQLANQSFQNYTTTAGHNPAATASKPASLIVDHFSPVDLHYLYALSLCYPTLGFNFESISKRLQSPVLFLVP